LFIGQETIHVSRPFFMSNRLLNPTILRDGGEKIVCLALIIVKAFRTERYDEYVT